MSNRVFHTLLAIILLTPIAVGLATNISVRIIVERQEDGNPN